MNTKTSMHSRYQSTHTRVHTHIHYDIHAGALHSPMTPIAGWMSQIAQHVNSLSKQVIVMVRINSLPSHRKLTILPEQPHSQVKCQDFSIRSMCTQSKLAESKLGIQHMSEVSTYPSLRHSDFEGPRHSSTKL